MQEIRAFVLCHFRIPSTQYTREHQFYDIWQDQHTQLQLVIAPQAQLDAHLETLRNHIHTQQAFENFVNYDVGKRGRLAYYANQENTSALDAIARLANLCIFVYQQDLETNTLKLITVRGNENVHQPTYMIAQAVRILTLS